MIDVSRCSCWNRWPWGEAYSALRPACGSAAVATQQGDVMHVCMGECIVLSACAKLYSEPASAAVRADAQQWRVVDV
jgi:hypothetical protein